MKILKPYFVFAVLWLVFVTVLLCIPGSNLPEVSWSNKIFLDKWVHIFLFLVLVWFWCKGYSIKTKKIFIVITIISIVYGFVMEIVQHFFIPFRSFDIGDMIADSIGSAAGYFISVKRLFSKN